MSSDTSDGQGTLLYDAAELDITALAVARDGALYAGSSPDGKVYRITADGHAEVFFDPGDKYIWSLAILNDGSLAVGTGDSGVLVETGDDAGEFVDGAAQPLAVLLSELRRLRGGDARGDG